MSGPTEGLRGSSMSDRGGVPCEVQPPEATERAPTQSDARTDALCAQVQRSLESVVGSGLRDAALEDLTVVDVAPTSRRLRVVLRLASEGEWRDPSRVLERLAAAKGFLRAEIAGDIHRKRTPELVFELLPTWSADPGEEVEEK